MWRKLKWKLTLIIALLVAVPVGLWVYGDYTIARDLQAELDAIRQRGEPLTPAEAAPKPVPDDGNAAVLYQKVFRADPNTGRPDSLLQRFSAEGYAAVGGLLKRDNEADARWLRDYFSDPERDWCLRTLRAASQRPHCVFAMPPGSNLTAPGFLSAEFRPAARIMAAKATIQAHDGHIDDALGWDAAILRMTDHLADQPSMIAVHEAGALQLIPLADLRHVLQAGEPSPGAVGDLDEALRRLDGHAALRDALIGQRAATLESFDILYGDPHRNLPCWPWTAEVFASGGSRVLAPVINSAKRADTLTYLRLMDDAIPLADQPYHLAAARIAALKSRVEALTSWRCRATRVLFFSSLDAAAARVDEADADIAMCRLVLALNAYRPTHGSYPAALTDLQPTIDWPIPEDPFSGKPYVYRTQENGFILYSLGPDCDDDGARTRGPDGDGDIVWECVK